MTPYVTIYLPVVYVADTFGVGVSFSPETATNCFEKIKKTLIQEFGVRLEGGGFSQNSLSLGVLKDRGKKETPNSFATEISRVIIAENLQVIISPQWFLAYPNIRSFLRIMGQRESEAEVSTILDRSLLAAPSNVYVLRRHRNWRSIQNGLLEDA